MEDQIEEKIEKKLKDFEKRIHKNTINTFQQLVEMMLSKEAKEKQEKEQRRRQKEEKEQRDKQERDEEKQRDKQERDEEKQRDKREKEERRILKEQEKIREKQEIMQKFESLEKRILDSEENFDKKIESMIERNTKQMKEEIENELVKNKKQMEKRMDVQDIHLKEIKEKICQDNLEVEGNIGTIGNKIEGVEKSIGTIEGKIKEVVTEQINQQQRLDRVQEELECLKQDATSKNEIDDQFKKKVQSEIEEVNQHQQQEQPIEEVSPKPIAKRNNKTIENVHTRKIETATQVEIIYGDMKFCPCKQTDTIYQHLQEVERVNKEADEEEIIANIQNILKRKADVWQENNKKQHTNVMKYERVLSNKFWGMLDSKEQYPLLEGKSDENCDIQEQQKVKIPENNQLKQLDANITNNELCKRNKRWKWTQESDDASVKRKKRP